MLKHGLLLAALMAPTSLWAGYLADGKITGIYCMGKNPANPAALVEHCMIYVSKAASDLAACAGSNNTSFTIPVGTDLAKAQLALATMAQVSKKTVSIGTLGVCTHRTGFEAVDYIREID